MRLSPSRRSEEVVCGVAALALENQLKISSCELEGKFVFFPCSQGIGHKVQGRRQTAVQCSQGEWMVSQSSCESEVDVDFSLICIHSLFCLHSKQSSSKPGSPAVPSPSQMDLEQQQHTPLFGTPPPPLPVPSVPMKEPPPGYEEAMKQQPKAQVRVVTFPGFLGEQRKSCHCETT